MAISGDPSSAVCCRANAALHHLSAGTKVKPYGKIKERGMIL